MKKFAKGLALFLVVCTLGYYGFTTYKKSTAFLGVVHENADSAIKVGIHDIRETIAWDALTSPGYYYKNGFDRREPEDDDEEENKGSGVTIPYNLLIYTLPEIQNTYFSTLEINNLPEFELFLKKSSDIKSLVIQESKDKSYRFVILKEAKMVLAWTRKKLVVAASLAPSYNKVKKVFNDILVENNTIKEDNHELLKVLKGESGHITFTNGKSISNFNFIDGEVQLEGKIPTLKSERFPEEISVETNPNASLSFHLDANFDQNFFREKFIQKFSTSTFFSKNNINVSQIANRTNGFFSFEIEGKTTQQDTIISYEYDENFEKVEQKTVQEKIAPKIRLKLGSGNESLQQYLSKVNVLDDNNIFTAFPLYQFQVEEDSIFTYFNTFSGGTISKEKTSSNFFDMRVNFEKLQQDLGISQTAKLFAHLENLRIFARQANKEKLKLEGRLTGKITKINILSQIFFGMQDFDKPQKEGEEL
jgi:hypothetical protein